jgi:hypothetical protein
MQFRAILRAATCTTGGKGQFFYKAVRKLSVKMNGDGCNGHTSDSPHDELQYLQQLKMIIEKGTKKGDRTGVGTLSVFGTQARYSLKDGNKLNAYNILLIINEMLRCFPIADN